MRRQEQDVRGPMTTYEVQGRRTVRDPDGKVRDVVRLASATTSDQAFGIAETMAGDDLTAWVFETEARLGRRTYKLLRVIPDGA
jgi:hypothetical protein